MGCKDLKCLKLKPGGVSRYVYKVKGREEKESKEDVHYRTQSKYLCIYKAPPYPVPKYVNIQYITGTTYSYRMWWRGGRTVWWSWRSIHCKKRLSIFPSPAKKSLTKIFLVGNITNFFYSVLGHSVCDYIQIWKLRKVLKQTFLPQIPVF